MATNWNAVLANINNASDILAILRKVLGLLDGKVDLTKIDEIIADISNMQTNVDTALTNVSSALSEFDSESQEAIQQVIAAGLMEGFATEVELLATRPTEPKKYAKAEDTDVIWFWNKPQGSADGSYWTSTGLSEYNRAINYVNANQFFKPIIINTQVDFRTLKTPGYYAFVSGQAWDASTNKPTGISNQWAFLEVFPISDVVVGQYVWCLNSQKKAFTFCNAANVWAPWSIYSDDTTLTNNILAQLPNQLTKNLRASYKSLSKNLLDPNTLQVGVEIVNNGLLSNEVNSITTELIDIRNYYAVSISGLQPNPSIGRFYRFLDKSGAVLSFGNIVQGNNSAVLQPPDNAVWFQMTIKQRNADALNIATAQIEYGIYFTSFTPFIKGEIVGVQGSIVEQPKVKLSYKAAGKNLLNKDSLIQGLAIWAQSPNEGKLVRNPKSVTTDLIDVEGLQQITLSGLQPNPELTRYYRFLDSNKVLLDYKSIPNPNTTYTIVVPGNAKFFQVSILENTATILDPSVTQIEAGTVATAYEPFKPLVSEVNGIQLAGSSSQSSSEGGSRAYGASITICGDSITETSDVDNGIVNQPNFRTQWPTYLYEKLKPKKFSNYARSGASFKENGQTKPWQMISHQINMMIANQENPDIIIVAMGTNDMNPRNGDINLIYEKLGNYDTAMSKATLADLDRTLSLEAARWAFWMIRTNFPNAVCFYVNPLQRALAGSDVLGPFVDGFSKLALRHGFTLIDQHHESGIVHELEVNIGSGQFLADGLHPDAEGKVLQVNYILSKVIPRMTY